MHPDMLRQLAVEHVRGLITEASAARRAYEARGTRRHRRAAHLRPAPPYTQSGSGPGPKTLDRQDEELCAL
jgi:hypothetical protein